MNALKNILSIAMYSFLIAFFIAPSAAFAQVATVAELTGTATAGVIQLAAAPGAPAAPAPVRRTVRKGDTVNQGETVSTGAMSSLVLRFTDGQVTALSANSSMAINNYTYNQAEPAKSNMLLSLLNGGMRAVTGLIGKAKPENVNYRAGNATIGIRGTDAFMFFDRTFTIVQVVSGQISFTFNGFTVSIPAGKGTYVDMRRPDVPIVVLSAADLATFKAIQAVYLEVTRALDKAMVLYDKGEKKLAGQALFGATVTLLTASSNASFGGGGAGLPNCSIVSPVSSRVPGTNCIAGQ